MGAVMGIEKTAVGAAYIDLTCDIVRQALDLGVRAWDGDVPAPVIVAVRMVLAVRVGREDTAADVEGVVVDWPGIDLGHSLVVPIDIGLDRTVTAQDETIALRDTGILIKTTTNEESARVILDSDEAVVGGVHSGLSLIA